MLANLKITPPSFPLRRMLVQKTLAQMGKLITWDAEGERKWKESWDNRGPAWNTNREK